MFNRKLREICFSFKQRLEWPIVVALAKYSLQVVLK